LRNSRFRKPAIFSYSVG